ncbi:MAG: FAD-binding protein [Deltaproteobacteria bacterium]|nr:FAD-binding protein [Deltaproteobacteria bacterium]
MAIKPDKWDFETDFVSIGSGIGGMTAAIVVHDLGKKAVVLEKAPKLGGVSAYSAGQLFLPNNHKMKEAGLVDSDEDAMKYFEFLGNGYGDRAMLERMYKAAHEAFPYLEKEAGIRWSYIKDFPDYYYPHVPGTLPEGRYLEVDLFDGSQLGEWQQKTYLSPVMPFAISHVELFEWGSFGNVLGWDFEHMAKNMEQDLRGLGSGMMASFIKAGMIDRVIPAYTDTPVRELVVENGAVIGVLAEREGKEFYVRAEKGVLIAAGGYDHDEVQARYWEDVPEWKSMVPKHVTGDNIMLGGDVGAALAGVPPGNLGCPLGYQIPGEEQEGVPLWRSSQEGSLTHSIFVNRAGKRFCDEAFYRDFQPAVRMYNGRIMDQPNYPTFLILDQNFREKYGIGTIMPGDPIPEGFGHETETLHELGKKLGIDAEQLEKTVERFNKFCDEGKDLDFGRGEFPWCAAFAGDKTGNLGHINKPPYFGIKLCPVNTGVNAVGLKTNINAQVMNLRGKPIQGLYATGNSSAQIEIGAGYNSGISNTRGLAWGYIAAHHAAS